ncbi:MULTISPECIES: replicative DNA helicase [unclassified Pseudomonas]|uniref:replicative DNA helicase n=1 Tax=unclassified Pseudomonas TaxID=196821 RepID=UPI000C8804C7|nr:MULTISPECIES: replicative DNA helicase [unclassified Pseudomonas]PMX29258.1 helicase DnaB [Pseudomonas sp. GW460-12]PMX36885.1 helicase DnaB [Pseudomonas sp. MPR-R2A4]PMX43281.1 helicase DnaB [Pseudomonas sp. MPR-R2A7]PMX53318.1 helicase DnaB [Pseudomonas sp. MPR-R2A6]PMX93406.1 helicase DnaB [Pseudomonas sp. MPR-R2A3]
MSEYRELYSDEAEHALLGSLMLDGELFDSITAAVTAADFHDPENAALFQVMLDLHATGAPVDPVTLHDFKPVLPSGGTTIAYAGELARNTPSTANWKAYARTVAERAVLRRLVEAADAVRDSANENRPVAEIIASAQQAMADLRDLDTGEPDYKRMDEVVARNIDIIDAKYNGSVQAGLSTGLVDLDKLVRGLRKKTVTIVAGLPGSGKTTLGLQIAQHISCTGLGVGMVFSLEMPEEELANRALASLGSIDLQVLDNGKLEDDDWPRLTSAVNKIMDKPLYVSDKSGLTVARIRSICRQVKRKHGLDVVVIDYIGLIGSDGKAFNRTSELGKISTGIVNIAKELEVPVILLAQLNRDSTKRPSKKPIASDLRDSGQIEADAHCIILVHRDMDSEEGQNGATELLMPKCRHAPVGSCVVQQQGKFARFVNFAGREPTQEEVEISRPFAEQYKGRKKP